MATPDVTPFPVPLPVGAETTSEQLLKLLTFLSPAFPVGGFSCSHGVEWLIDSGAIRTADGLAAWIADLLELGSGWNDAVLFAAAHRAAEAGDSEALGSIAELAEALAPSCERHAETTGQGRAFLEAVSAAWPSEPVSHLMAEGGAAYPVAVGAAAAGNAIPLGAALAAYLNAFVANLVSVGVRLIPIGQNAGLKVVAALHPLVAETMERALRSTLDDLGSAAVLSDIASMRHETQYSRVFRT
ncbi:MAG: urease accessory protein UreF [Propylenella sp.]